MSEFEKPTTTPIVIEAEAEAEAETEVETALDDLAADLPQVGIIMGSKSDMEEMERAGQVLDNAGVRFEIRVMSAHRDPEDRKSVV